MSALTAKNDSNTAGFTTPSSNQSYKAADNRTLPVEFDLTVIAAVGVMISEIILTTALNAFVLLVILCQRSLQTPFSVYIVNLLMVNLLRTVLVSPIQAFSALHRKWPFSYLSCTVFLYTYTIMNAVMISSHLIICLNRIWCIVRPITYKRYHSKKMSCLLCAAIWLIVHVVLLPQILRDHLYYRIISRSDRCLLHTYFQRELTTTTHVLGFLIPWVLVIASCPVVLVLRRGRQGNNRVTTGTNKITPVRSQITPSIAEATKTKERIPIGKKSAAFTVLTCFTASVAVFWTPLVAFITINNVTGAYYHATFLNTAVALFSLEPLLDPLYFCFALGDLRIAVNRILCSLCR